MTTDAPLLVLLQAEDEQSAISRAESSAFADYDTVKVLDCKEGSSGVWTVRLTVGSPKQTEAGRSRAASPPASSPI